MAITALALLFEWAPRRRQPEASWLAFGAACSLLLWLVFMAVLVAYVEATGSFGATYGPIAGTIGVLLWTFLSSVALFLGLAVAAQLEAVRAGVPAPRVERDDTTRNPRRELETAPKGSDPFVALRREDRPGRPELTAVRGRLRTQRAAEGAFERDRAVLAHERDVEHGLAARRRRVEHADVALLVVGVRDARDLAGAFGDVRVGERDVVRRRDPERARTDLEEPVGLVGQRPVRVAGDEDGLAADALGDVAQEQVALAGVARGPAAVAGVGRQRRERARRADDLERRARRGERPQQPVALTQAEQVFASPSGADGSLLNWRWSSTQTSATPAVKRKYGRASTSASHGASPHGTSVSAFASWTP
jgi:hypothetical protein